MQGWLVVNSFLDSKKFEELYAFLSNAASEYNVSLEKKTTAQLLCALDDNFSQFSQPDFVLFWDKDVYLAKRLEDAKIKVFNNSTAIGICDNKILTALALVDKVKMPKTIIVPKTFDGVGYKDKGFVKKAVNILGLPIVIKEAYGSFGQQVYLANSIEEIYVILDKIGYKDCLMQQFVTASRGKDVRINVVGDKVVCAMLRTNDKDFRSNITNGGCMQTYTPSENFKNIALAAVKEIGMDFAGVDVMFGEDGEGILCEVNASPHFKSSLQATGIDMSKRIMQYIVESIR